jgi:type I restriction enzyme S subunit
LIRPNPAAVNTRWLHYYFFGPEWRAVVAANTLSGATVERIPLSSFPDFPIRLPDLQTQRRIASILSAYDDLIENNTRRIAILEEMARRIYEEWFVRFRFPGHEQVKMVESELGLIPEGWKVVAASDAITISPKVRVPKEGLKPFVPMGSLSENSMLIAGIEEREGNSGSKFQNGDTLFARITPCLENGKTGFVQFLPSHDAVAFGSTEFIVLRSRTLCPEYVYALARSDEFRANAIKSMSGATGRQRVKEACFDAFLLAQPDAETLQRYREIAQPMFAMIRKLAAKNANLRATRDLLLPKLISGELDVSTLSEPTV